MMIVVARNIGRSKPALLVTVLVDDVLLRRLLAILIRSALNLVGARSGAPKKLLRESVVVYAMVVSKNRQNPSGGRKKRRPAQTI